MRLLVLISLLLAIVPSAAAIGTSQCAGSPERDPAVGCAFVDACCGAGGSFFVHAGSHAGVVGVGWTSFDVEATTSSPTNVLVCATPPDPNIPPDPVVPPDPVCTALTPPDPCHAALPVAPPDPCRSVPDLLP